MLTSTPAAPTQSREPKLIHVLSSGREVDTQLSMLIAEMRTQADAFVFLSGGASNMQENHKRQLMAMFEALTMLARSARRIVVGDGGTKAGIMEAAGLARKASGNAFPLIGVVPAAEIPPRGTTPVDPHHSHIIAVDNPAAPAGDAWGSETETMYWLFDRLAKGMPSVTVIANGGGITLTEVDANVEACRHMILIEGSGRAADALVSLLRKTSQSDSEVQGLRARAEKASLTRRPALFNIVPLTAGASGLRDAIAVGLGAASTSSGEKP